MLCLFAETSDSASHIDNVRQFCFHFTEGISKFFVLVVYIHQLNTANYLGIYTQNYHSFFSAAISKCNFSIFLVVEKIMLTHNF